MTDDMIGEWVVIRGAHVGVWLGRLVAAEPQGDTLRVRLAEARRAWSWAGATEAAGLALRGPISGQITAPVAAVVLLQCTEVHPATAAAVAAWDKVPVWTA